MKKYWKEIMQPKNDIEYWVVYNPKDGLPHYFLTEVDAFEYSSWNDIPDKYVMPECFN